MKMGSKPDMLARYIKWTQATFKAGGHQAELTPLLERCTRELQSDERYKNDLRYLRLWIQYVSFPNVSHLQFWDVQTPVLSCYQNQIISLLLSRRFVAGRLLA